MAENEEDYLDGLLKSLSEDENAQSENKDEEEEQIKEPPVQDKFCERFRVKSVFNRFCSTNFTEPSPIVILLMARFRFGSDVRLKDGR